MHVGSQRPPPPLLRSMGAMFACGLISSTLLLNSVLAGMPGQVAVKHHRINWDDPNLSGAQTEIARAALACSAFRYHSPDGEFERCLKAQGLSGASEFSQAVGVLQASYTGADLSNTSLNPPEAESTGRAPAETKLNNRQARGVK